MIQIIQNQIRNQKAFTLGGVESMSGEHLTLGNVTEAVDDLISLLKAKKEGLKSHRAIVKSLDRYNPEENRLRIHDDKMKQINKDLIKIHSLDKYSFLKGGINYPF